LIFEVLYPQPELDQLIEHPQPVPIDENPAPEEPASGELLDDELASQ